MTQPPGPPWPVDQYGRPWPVDQYGRPLPADRYGQPWPVDEYGRPWPADQFGRPWPADPYGRPVSPYLPSGQADPQAAGDAGDPRLYPGAPATLVDAVASEATTGGRVRVATWGLWDPVLGLIIWFGLGLVGGIAALAADEAAPATYGVAMIFAVILPWLGLVGWPALMTRIKGNGLLTDLGVRWRWSDIGLGAAFGIAALIVAVILAAVTEALFGEFDSSAGELAEQLASQKIVLAIFLLTVVVGAPIAEEIFFRGFLFGALAKKGLHPAWAMVISAIVFAAIHIEPVRIILLTGVGLVLGLARWLTRSTTTSIMAHFVNNLVGSLSLIGELFS